MCTFLVFLFFLGLIPDSILRLFCCPLFFAEGSDMLCRKAFIIDISHLTSQTGPLHALTLFSKYSHTIKPYIAKTSSQFSYLIFRCRLQGVHITHLVTENSIKELKRQRKFREFATRYLMLDARGWLNGETVKRWEYRIFLRLRSG